MVNAVVILETARRAVRTIVVSAEERRLDHGTFLAPVTGKTPRGVALNETLEHTRFLERPIQHVRDKGRTAGRSRAREYRNSMLSRRAS